MADRFDIIFRGDVVPGHHLAEVKAQLKALFKADDAQMDRLFSGRPVPIKRGADKETADRYQQSLQKAGALVQVRPAAESQAGEEPAEPSATFQSALDDITVAPVGADVLNPDEREQASPVQVDISHLQVEPVGADVLKENERKPIEDRNIDTSHLHVEGGG